MILRRMLRDRIDVPGPLHPHVRPPGFICRTIRALDDAKTPALALSHSGKNKHAKSPLTSPIRTNVYESARLKMSTLFGVCDISIR
jgi:hypothetical protein